MTLIKKKQPIFFKLILYASVVYYLIHFFVIRNLTFLLLLSVNRYIHFCYYLQ